jgi:hypothetical protein
MLRNRFLILLGGSLLAASAAWADDIGYIDCSNHSDATQVFAKARKSPEVVASVPCGERFTILVYGFVFSRVQTKDGNVGYVYSNLISVDRGTASVQKTASPQLSDAKMKVPSSTAPVAQAAPAASVKPQPAPVQSVQASTPTLPSAEVVSSAVASPAASPNAPQPAAATLPAQPAPVEPTPAPASSPASNLPEVAAPASVQPTAELASLSASSAASSSAVSSNAPEPAPAAAQPAPTASAAPEPATPAIRPKETRSTWERPNPGGRRGAPLIELYGAYAFARMDNGGGSTTNLNGAMGSFGWNFKSWLQVVADSSYSVVTVSGTKNVLYGNHFGPRYFHRGRNRWGLTPFAEALVGGSRADATATVSGATVKTSQNCLSYKLGGGVDIHPSRRFDIRLFDADYYRTAFGTNLHQNNYWISAGIVIRLFGGNDTY